MTATLKASIRDSKAARWGALGIVSFTMMAAYFFTDVMSPLKTMLETQNGWDSSDYGFFTSAYGWLNVFFVDAFLWRIDSGQDGASALQASVQPC